MSTMLPPLTGSGFARPTRDGCTCHFDEDICPVDGHQEASIACRLASDPLPPPNPDDALSFDEVEAAGLDGTLRGM